MIDDTIIISKNNIEIIFINFLFIITPRYNYIIKAVINQIYFHIIKWVKNMKMNIKNTKLINQKRRYMIVIIMTLIGIIIGLAFPYFLSADNELLLKNSVVNYFESIDKNNYNTFIAIKNASFLNISIPLIIWFLGLSVLGAIFIIPILCYKGFILGFSFSSIVYIYKIKGILGAFLYVFPNLILALIVYILLSFYAIGFSFKLFRYLFMKDKLELNLYMNKYFRILAVSLIILILLSLYEVYLLPILLKLFTKII